MRKVCIISLDPSYGAASNLAVAISRVEGISLIGVFREKDPKGFHKIFSAELGHDCRYGFDRIPNDCLGCVTITSGKKPVHGYFPQAPVIYCNSMSEIRATVLYIFKTKSVLWDAAYKQKHWAHTYLSESFVAKHVLNPIS